MMNDKENLLPKNPRPKLPRVVIGKPTEPNEPVKDWRERYVTFEQFRDVKPPEFLIEGFIEDGAVLAIAGPVAQRKSIVAANVMASLLTGEPLFGFFKVAKQPERVIYICPEMGLAEIARRLGRLGLGEYVGKRLFIRSMDDAIIKLTELDEELPGSVVVLDTLTRFVEGDQNSSEDMAQFAQLVFEIRRRGSTVILLHHSVKGAGRVSLSLDSALRGSTELAAFVTCVWATQLVDEDRPHVTASVLKCVKQRGFAADPFQVSCDENYRMRMLVRPGEMSEIKTKKEVEAEAVLAAILKESPNLGITKIREEMKKAGHAKGQKWVTLARARILGTGVKINGMR